MIRDRSRLGFFLLTKVTLVLHDPFSLRLRLTDDATPQSFLVFPLFLPRLIRRRLYARLLQLSSSSTYLGISWTVSCFNKRQARARKLQVNLRHSFLVSYASLQASNQYILVESPATLALARLLGLGI